MEEVLDFIISPQGELFYFVKYYGNDSVQVVDWMTVVSQAIPDDYIVSQRIFPF